MKPPHELDLMTDVVMAYRPKKQQKKASKRQARKAKRAAKAKGA
jgi:hypothetical protein